jgi:cation transport regulator ChaC
MAYEIPSADPDNVLAGLDHRERGGYERIALKIEIHGEGTDRVAAFSVTGLVYIAGPRNDNYLGAAPIEAIANQIATASGPSGANPEYVFELANRLRAMNATDVHVYSVEAELRRAMARSREL